MDTGTGGNVDGVQRRLFDPMGPRPWCRPNGHQQPVPPLSSTHSGVYTLMLWGIPEGTSVV